MTKRRILIVLLGSLGDVARGLSITDRIKEVSPDVHITWLVEPKCREIVMLSKCIDEVLIFDRGKPLRDTYRLWRTFRKLGFNTVLDMQRHAKSGFFSWLTGAEQRVGFHRKDAKEFNWIFQTETIEAGHSSLNKFYQYQNFLHSLGITPKNNSRAELIGSALGVGILPQGPYVFLVLGSSWPSKDWVPEGYDLLIAELREKKVSVVLVGESSMTSLADSMSVKRDGVTNLVGRTTLSELVEVIRGASLGIGPDSGPGHIAAALGIRYISLFGPTSPKRVSPIGSEHLVVTASIGCSPCNRRVCPGLDKLCMRLIPVPAIMDKVRVADRDLIR